MKLSEFLRFINETLEFNSQELETLAGASSIQELTVEDSLQDSFKKKFESFLTFDSAKNNKDIEAHFKKALTPKIKGEILGNTDTKIMSFAKELLNEDEYKSVEEADFTPDKVKHLLEGVKRLVTEKSNDEESKKLIESYKKQLSQAEEEKNKIIKEKEEEYKKSINDFNQKLKRKEFYRAIDEGYELAEAYRKPVIKKALYDNLFEEATKKAHIDLTENGDLTLKDLEDPEKDFYVSPTKLGKLNDVIDPAIKDFLKTSDAPKEKPKGHPKPQVIDDNINPMIADRFRDQVHENNN